MSNNKELEETIAALAAGQLPDVSEAILKEAQARWGLSMKRPPGLGYSEEAQRLKIEKDLAKRYKRSKVLQNQGNDNG